MAETELTKEIKKALLYYTKADQAGVYGKKALSIPYRSCQRIRNGERGGRMRNDPMVLR